MQHQMAVIPVGRVWRGLQQQGGSRLSGNAALWAAVGQQACLGMGLHQGGFVQQAVYRQQQGMVIGCGGRPQGLQGVIAGAMSSEDGVREC